MEPFVTTLEHAMLAASFCYQLFWGCDTAAICKNTVQFYNSSDQVPAKLNTYLCNISTKQ
jgi:hypothetical protein